MYRLLLLPVLLIATISQGQIEGDDLFGVDQIATIDLEFPESNYWTTLTANYEADENEYIPAFLTLTDIYGTQTFDSVGVRLKGNSSYNHPGNKKSFKIDFNKYITGQNYDGLKKLNFSNGFKDPTCIRENIFSDVCLAAGIPAPRNCFANVYFNGTFWGFYSVIEQIDDQFLDWAILDDDGNLFKAGDNFGGGPGGSGDAADLVYYGESQTEYADKYEIKTNEDENDWTDLIEFIDFINNSSDEEFETGLEYRLELTEYLRSLALDNLFSNLDSYTGSARNYYLYHNLTTTKWEWIKWDGNETFGSYTNGQNNMTSLAIDYVDNDRPLIERIFENENLYSQYLAQICDIQENYFNSDYMDARIDEVRDLIQASVYADDNKMYSNADFNTNIESNLTGGGPGPGGGITYGLKSFVEARSTYVQGQVDCSLFTGLEDLHVENLKVYPNPSTGQIQIDLSDHTELFMVQLITMDGRIALEESIQGGAARPLDISELRGGLYSIMVQSKKTTAQSRILVR